jgi:hypothetical protein
MGYSQRYTISNIIRFGYFVKTHYALDQMLHLLFISPAIPGQGLLDLERRVFIYRNAMLLQRKKDNSPRLRNLHSCRYVLREKKFFNRRVFNGELRENNRELVMQHYKSLGMGHFRACFYKELVYKIVFLFIIVNQANTGSFNSRVYTYGQFHPLLYLVIVGQFEIGIYVLHVIQVFQPVDTVQDLFYLVCRNFLF